MPAATITFRAGQVTIFDRRRGPGWISMAVYRRFAGMEPRPLPEPVIATDLDALVPEDHPSRRFHAVVLNG